MKLKELIENLDYRQIEHITECEIKGISCNSRNIRPGDLFVAIKGQRFNGHNFVHQAVNKGSPAVIIQEGLPLKIKATKIIVADSQAALACVCAKFFGYPAKRLRVIGITGTNGKTTVSYLIEKILSSAGRPAGVIGTIDYRLGESVYPAINTTPAADILQSFLQEIVLAQTKYAIIEVSSHALTQHRVDYVDFTSAVFTNLTPEHLDYHGSLDNYFACKSTLFTGMDARGWAIINADDTYGQRLIKKVTSRVITYGLEAPAQIKAENIRLHIDRLQFTALTPEGKIEMASPLIGRHNVYNILAAIGIALSENIDFSHIAQGIESMPSVCGRLEAVDFAGGFRVFIDYAHTEDALRNTLQTLRRLNKQAKIILVFGCGGDRDSSKRPKMGRLATELADSVIITSDNPRSEDPQRIASDIIRGINKKAKNYHIILDRFRAIQQALFIAKSGDTVVIAGKGHESTQVFADHTIHFNDREAVQKLLQTK